MCDVRRWLDSLGLGQYADAFERNAIDGDLLSELDHDVLISIGIDLAGHRLRILKATRELTAVETPPPAVVAETGFTEPECAPLGAAERRQLTVMFCDLADSTTLATQLDAEDLRDVLSGFQDVCREAVARFDGFVARYMGDGVLVYFGYPRAHEDDPERAVRAGLDILAAIPRLNAHLGARFRIELAVRIGVATGEVVVADIVGEGAAEEAAVVAETPNLAARLQGSAQPGELVVNATTARRLPEAFRLDDLGELELKGIAALVRAWRVVAGKVSVSASASPREWRVPLVGRREELGLALRAWDRAKADRGQALMILGEAGIGKSRLADALRRSAVEDGCVCVALEASPYHLASPLYPVTMLLRHALGWEDSDEQAVRMDKLEQFAQAQPMLGSIDALRVQIRRPSSCPSRS